MDRTAETRIAISVNGDAAELPAGATVLDVARRCGLRDDERGVAIARCGEVVPRATWGEVGLDDGDALEVVRATAGG